MIRKLFIILFFIPFFADAQEANFVVKEGNPRSVIIIPALAQDYVVDAAKDFQYHIERSSGVRLSIISENSQKPVPEGFSKIFIGKGKAAKELEEEYNKLQFEEFWIKSTGNDLFFLANDSNDNPAVHYAVCEWLEKMLGAKWLWPGDLGTYVPKHENISLGSWNYRWKSPMDVREFYLIGNKKEKEVNLWLTRHRIRGRRAFSTKSNYKFWGEKYGEKYPEILAKRPETPPGVNLPPFDQKFYLKSPKFIELIYEDWIEKGSPDHYALISTDGRGFDYRLLPDEDPLKVYRGNVSLTPAYLDFYEDVKKYFNARGANPRFDVLAYSAYRDFPEGRIFDGKDFNVFIVTGDTTFTRWESWSSTGAHMYLRPNWWHGISLGPFMNYRQQGTYFKFAKENGLHGFYFDAILNQWALQGINYYTIARLSYKDISIDDVLQEYASAFGTASNNVKEYLVKAEKYSDLLNGDTLALIKEKLDVKRVYYSNPMVLPHVFPDHIIKDFKRTINIKSISDPETQARLEWLDAGLDFTLLVNDYILKTWGNKGNNLLLTGDLLENVAKIEESHPFAVSTKTLESRLRKKYKFSGMEKKKKVNKK